MINSEGAPDTPIRQAPMRPFTFMQGGAPGRRSKGAQEFCGGAYAMAEAPSQVRTGGRRIALTSCWGRAQESANSGKPKNIIEFVVAVGGSAGALPPGLARNAAHWQYKRAPGFARGWGMQLNRRLWRQAAPVAPKRPDDRPALGTLLIGRFEYVMRCEDSGPGGSDDSAHEC